MSRVDKYSTNSKEQLMAEMKIQNGHSLMELSYHQPVLLVFLRHFGCTFCREALADIAKQRSEIETLGIKIVLVHMSNTKLAERYFTRYDLSGVDHVSDPECRFYAGFGLTKGTFNQLFGLKSWARGFQAGILEGHFIGNQLGDGFQMPGIFVISHGEVQSSFIHREASDRPDYYSLVQCCSPQKS
ncbi:MAG: peroxiredoxin-like family protein [Bacteroidota bacterium]